MKRREKPFGKGWKPTMIFRYAYDDLEDLNAYRKSIAEDNHIILGMIAYIEKQDVIPETDKEAFILNQSLPCDENLFVDNPYYSRERLNNYYRQLANNEMASLAVCPACE